MRRPTRPRRRWPLAIALLIIALTAIYATLDILGALRNRGSLPVLAPPRAGDCVLVIAPHEDDETLGCGGYMQAAVTAGATVYVCLMTAGEGEELGAAWATRRPPLSPKTFVRLGQIRQRESRQALASIGVPADHVIFLNYPNLGLSEMWTARYFSRANLWTSRYTKTTHSPFADGVTPHAPFCGEAVLADLQTVIRRVQPTVIFTVHPGDVHRDHWATYCFTRLALAELQARHAVSPQLRLFTYLVHRRGWPVPWGYYPRLPLTPPPALARRPFNHWLSYPLTSTQVRQKNQMIGAYRSQAPAFDLLLRAFDRRNELFAQIVDVPLHEGTVQDAALLQEPIAETEYLRLHPGADLAAVGFVRQGQTVHVSFTTVSPIKAGTVARINLVAVNPLPDHPRAVLVEIETAKPARSWLVSDVGGLVSPAKQPITLLQVGNQLTVTLPAAYASNGQPLILDVLTMVRHRIVDHALTRVFVPAPVPHPTRRQEPQSHD